MARVHVPMYKHERFHRCPKRFFFTEDCLKGTRLIADNVMFVGDRHGRTAND